MLWYINLIIKMVIQNYKIDNIYSYFCLSVGTLIYVEMTQNCYRNVKNIKYISKDNISVIKINKTRNLCELTNYLNR